MLTIDTIPLNINGKLKVENGKINPIFSILNSPFSITCFPYAADACGSDGRTF
jgi:hypothetical protein